MKKLLVTLAAVLVSVSSFAQATSGTITFNNRGLSPATAGGTPYNAPINNVTDPASARAQLYLVTGTAGSEVYTPLTPLQTFRASPNQAFFVGPVSVSVDGQAPGTSGLRFVVRAWQGAANYDAAVIKGQSDPITVAAGLGGTGPGGVFLPPDLGGPNGLQSFSLVPEPSTIALGVLGAAALLYRRRK
jgi:hypothetical protein